MHTATLSSSRSLELKQAKRPRANTYMYSLVTQYVDVNPRPLSLYLTKYWLTFWTHSLYATHGVRQKSRLFPRLKALCHLQLCWATAWNFNAKLRTLITCSYLLTKAKRHPIFSYCSKATDFFARQITTQIYVFWKRFRTSAVYLLDMLAYVTWAAAEPAAEPDAVR